VPLFSGFKFRMHVSHVNIRYTNTMGRHFYDLNCFDSRLLATKATDNGFTVSWRLSSRNAAYSIRKILRQNFLTPCVHHYVQNWRAVQLIVIGSSPFRISSTSNGLYYLCMFFFFYQFLQANAERA